MTSPWDLIGAKRYQDAIAEYSRLYDEEGGHLHLQNRGLAHLLVEDFSAALNDFQKIFETSDPKHRTDGELIYAGIASWCLGRPHDAVRLWRDGLSAPYTDAAGGVEVPALLLYAGCRTNNQSLRNEGEKLLTKHWNKHLRRQKKRQERSSLSHHDLVHPGLIAWPGAIVPFLLAESNHVMLQKSVDSAGNEILKQRWQCAADFYIGLRAACDDDMATFGEQMRKCSAAPKKELEHESYLATWEVATGFREPAFGSDE